VYQWRKDGTNLANGTKFSGVLTPGLVISNVAAAELGAYTLFVTNSAGSTNSSAASLIKLVSSPSPSTSYEYAILTNNPMAYWRLNEAVDPSTNPPCYDYIGGGIGTYGSTALKANGPQPGLFPGFENTNTAVQSTAFDAQSVTSVSPLFLNTNTVTFAAWIYPIGAQQEFAGLFWSHAGSTAAGLSYGNHFTTPSSVGQLNYMWNLGTTWTFVSGLTIPSDQWSFVALVISPSSGTLYLGTGGPLTNAVNSIPHQNELWNGPAVIGIDPLYSPERVFNGVIDEVAIFNRSLTLDQVNTLYNIGRGVVQPVPPSFTGDAPASQVLYAGRTARFKATATGSLPLVYQWRRNNTNISNSGNISGAQTDTLTISNVGAADVGDYTVKVTNSVAAITSSPPASLAIAVPSGKGYEASVRAANPIAYWRLNETGDPSTNTPAFDYWGGFAGTYGYAALNGFNSIGGPQPPEFPEFEATNSGLESPPTAQNSWVTVPPLNLNTNTVTIALWLQPATDPVQDFAGLFFSREASANVNGVGLRYGTNGQLGYVWNLGATETSQFSTGLYPPEGQWSFACLVVEPTRATIYLYNTNGLASATNTISHTAESWDGHGLIGYDGGFFNHNFPGLIDEVAVFNYAFTPAQVLSLYNSAFSTALPPVRLTIQQAGPNIVVSWPQGVLQEANDLTGTWTTNNATSPYTNPAPGARKFYRVILR
jgi:hypothetical protein